MSTFKLKVYFPYNSDSRVKTTTIVIVKTLLVLFYIQWLIVPVVVLVSLVTVFAVNPATLLDICLKFITLVSLSPTVSSSSSFSCHSITLTWLFHPSRLFLASPLYPITIHRSHRTTSFLGAFPCTVTLDFCSVPLMNFKIDVLISTWRTEAEKHPGWHGGRKWVPTCMGLKLSGMKYFLVLSCLHIYSFLRLKSANKTFLKSRNSNCCVVWEQVEQAGIKRVYFFPPVHI